MAKRKATEIGDLRFLPTDFERFRPEVQRDPVHNAARLEVRRKLESVGKHLARTLAGADHAFAARASLHHPFRFNAYRVNSQFVYLSRAEPERRDLKKILGVELGRDLDQNYVHVLLTLEIHHEGLTLGLRIHKDAWWDGENLKRRVRKPEERDKFAAALRGLPDYGLRIHDHRRVRACGDVTPADIVEAMRYYTPGEHWLHIVRDVDRCDAFVTEESFIARLEEEFRRLLPAYLCIRWTAGNNYLFSGKN